MTTTKRTTKAAAPKTAAKKATTKKAATKKATKKASPKSASPPASGQAKTTKLSAINAAAKVLAESKTAMTTKEMIDAMAEQKLWTSPGGKTPSQTLYSAILREIATKGSEARFVKAERGKFAANR